MFIVFRPLSVQCETNRIGSSAHYRRHPVMCGLLLVLMLTFMNVTGAAESIRVDDALYSVFEETSTPGDMVDYKRYYEYDTVSDLADLQT